MHRAGAERGAIQTPQGIQGPVSGDRAAQRLRDAAVRRDGREADRAARAEPESPGKRAVGGGGGEEGAGEGKEKGTGQESWKDSDANRPLGLSHAPLGVSEHVMPEFALACFVRGRRRKTCAEAKHPTLNGFELEESYSAPRKKYGSTPSIAAGPATLSASTS